MNMERIGIGEKSKRIKLENYISNAKLRWKKS